MTMYASTFDSDPPTALVYRRLGARPAAIGMLITLLLFASALLLIDHYARPAPNLEPLPTLWPEGSYTTPESYQLWTSDGSYMAASGADRWRWDRGGQTIQLGDGTHVWDTRGPGMYWAIPYAGKVASGEVTDVPHLQDGRPITADTNPLSMWRVQSGLGPTHPDRLMQEIEMARRYGGTWRLSSDRFLGVDVQILDVQIPQLPGLDGEYPYARTIMFDPRYLLVLSHRLTSPQSSSHNEVTELRLNQPVADSVFEFMPPAGYRQCLPPQFANRGEGC